MAGTKAASWRTIDSRTGSARAATLPAWMIAQEMDRYARDAMHSLTARIRTIRRLVVGRRADPSAA